MMQRRQSNAGTAIVRGVLTEREPPVQLQVIDYGEVAVLVGNTASPLFEALGVFRRPPIAQISLRIIFASLIVEAMRQLMSNYHADAAKIGRIIRILVEERRLQNSCWKYNLIPRRRIVGVDRRWRHAPFVRVRWFADLIDIAF